jgi:surfactin synthase thioesterase subunit
MRGSFSEGVVWPAPRPRADLVLVCFSYCGGGTVPFRPWVRAIPDNVDLALVCLPGRESRAPEPLVQSWDALMREALISLRSVVRRPYVVFGHSQGAWVAFEATVHMEQTGEPAPQALVVSASRAPSQAEQVRAHRPTSHDSDAELIAWMTTVGQLSPLILEEPSLRQMALDLFRADKRAGESYRFTPDSRVHTPLRLLSAVDDPDVDPDDGAWSRLAAGAFQSEVLPGGHFYTDEVWAQLPRHMGL